jgi:hypothetical protein
MKYPVAQAFQPVQAQAEACGYILQEAPHFPYIPSPLRERVRVRVKPGVGGERVRVGPLRHAKKIFGK